MRRENIESDLSDLAFEFFYAFSRFEYALKENHYLRWEEVGAAAEPSWDKFTRKFRDVYVLGPAARGLLDAKPQREVVAAGGDLEFVEVVFNPGVAELDQVKELARIVRNNLFHGGKHGSAYWDDPERMEMLLRITIATLKELAELGGLGGSFERYY